MLQTRPRRPLILGARACLVSNLLRRSEQGLYFVLRLARSTSKVEHSTAYPWTVHPISPSLVLSLTYPVLLIPVS